MYSARRLMVFNVRVKFRENMSNGFKVIERTRKLLTDRQTHRHTHTHTHTHREKTKTLYPLAYFVCREYNKLIWTMVSYCKASKSFLKLIWHTSFKYLHVVKHATLLLILKYKICSKIT